MKATLVSKLKKNVVPKLTFTDPILIDNKQNSFNLQTFQKASIYTYFHAAAAAEDNDDDY